MSHFITLSMFAFLLIGINNISNAEEFLVDQADTTDFEEFHKIADQDKNKPSLKERIEAAFSDTKPKMGNSRSINRNNNFDRDKKTSNSAVGNLFKPSPSRTAPSRSAGHYPAAPLGNTLIASGTLNDNASQTVNSLYKTMNQHCANGWIKHREWTQKDVTQGTFILQFEYSCK